MRRNYILFHFPWVWLNLQRQKASLEVPGDWKKKKKKKSASQLGERDGTSAPKTSSAGSCWGMDPRRESNAKKRTLLSWPPRREGLHRTSYTTLFVHSTSPALYPRLLRQTLPFLQTYPGCRFIPAKESKLRCHGAFNNSFAVSECRGAWAAT